MLKSLSVLALACLCLSAFSACNNATDVAANRTVTGSTTTSVASLKISSMTPGDFGTLKPSSSKNILIIFENTSSSDSVSIKSIALEKTNQHFTFQSLPTLPLIIAPKGSPKSSLNLNIRFDADVSLGSFHDALVLNGDLSASSQLNARILMVPPDTIDINPDCVVSTSTLDFDTVSTANPNRTMSFVLTNNDSDSYMRIPTPVWSLPNSTCPFAMISPNFPTILPPSSSVTVTVSASNTVGGTALPSGTYVSNLSFGNAISLSCHVIVFVIPSNEIITTDLTTTRKLGAKIHFACHIVNRSTQPCTLTSIPTISNTGFDCVFSIVNTTLPVTIAANGGAIEIIGDLVANSIGTYTESAIFGITAGSGVILDKQCDINITIIP